MKHMMIDVALFCLLMGCASGKREVVATPATPVFESGSEGYSHFRIPSLVKNDHYLFAFAEGRRNSVSDHGDIAIVLRRSPDLGKTWEKLTPVVEVAGESVQNPVAIYIREENKLVLLFTKRTVGADTEHMIRAGTSAGYVGVYSTESLDEGLSWSAPKEISDSVKKDNWRWYALGPGGAIRMEFDKNHTGRIIIPANHSTDQGADNDFLGAHALYSDDGAKSWKIGAVDSEGQSTVNPNETTVVELKDGSLYFNTRNHSSKDTVANRAVAISRDGGLHFESKFAHEKQLLTPVVHASLTRNKRSLFFFAPFDRKDRKDLSLWRSDDEGRHWTYDRLVYSGPAAYSSAVTLSEKSLGLLLEVDGYERILYQAVPVN